MDNTHKPVILIFNHLPKATHNAFDVLATQRWLKENEWYLAGGTALALQCDHRVSVDLDFFTPHTDFDVEQIISVLTGQGWTTSLREKGTLYGELKGVKISFIIEPEYLAALLRG